MTYYPPPLMTIHDMIYNPQMVYRDSASKDSDLNTSSSSSTIGTNENSGEEKQSKKHLVRFLY